MEREGHNTGSNLILQRGRWKIVGIKKKRKDKTSLWSVTESSGNARSKRILTG